MMPLNLSWIVLSVCQNAFYISHVVSSNKACLLTLSGHSGIKGICDPAPVANTTCFAVIFEIIPFVLMVRV